MTAPLAFHVYPLRGKPFAGGSKYGLDPTVDKILHHFETTVGNSRGISETRDSELPFG